MRAAALGVVALLWLGGCANGGVVEIHLSHPADLRPSEQLTELVIRIVDADLSRRIVEVQIDGSDVGHGGVADLGALRPGERYVAHVVATARERCLASGGRVVGRSVPFEHRSGTYTVPVQVGCADEYAAVEPLHFPRLAHAIVPLSDGSAYVFGGARNQIYGAEGVEVPEPFEGLNDTRLVERYLPAERGFSDHAVLDEVRVLPTGTATTDDAMAVVGGQLASIFCDSQVEVVLQSGQIARRVSALDERQCGPTAARVGDRIAIVGGAFRPDETFPYQHDAVILDGLANGVIAELDTGRFRYSPLVVPFDDGSGALVAGGDAFPFAEILWLPPGGEPRFEPVAGGPDPGWTEGEAAFVPCLSGGGAVYVVGGSYGGPDPEALDQTWCYRYPGGGADPEPVLLESGLLPAARRIHRVDTVSGPGGTYRLLLTGGFGGLSSDGYALLDYQLLTVDGCTCADVADAGRRDLPSGNLYAFHVTTPLADGSVLLAGGAARTEVAGPDLVRILGADGALLFIPDQP